MNPHNLVPLVAFLLNVSLAGLSLYRNPKSRLNRVFAYFASGIAVWNIGVFMLRQVPDEASAYFWEVIIHIGVIALPPLYYHFVLIFLERTSQHRRSLTLAYALAVLFTAFNVSESPLFIRGVTQTYWGWAPATGPLYTAFFVYFNAFLVAGLYRLKKGYKGVESSFRRNRARLILFGTLASVLGGFVDFTRFILAGFIPAADQIYPVGIPTNMIFSLMVGLSIVRYRLFDVNVAVKKGVIYAGLCAAIAGVLVIMTHTLHGYFDLENVTALWVIPLAVVMTLILAVGPRLEDLFQRIMFTKRRGCYEVLLDLSMRMSAILDLRKLTDTLIQGLVRGIPATHAILMTYDPERQSFIVRHADTATGERIEVRPIPATSPVAAWLTQTGQVLVKEEILLNQKMAASLEFAGAELEEIPASVIVPLKVENEILGILFVGEKLSGEIFDSQELEVLSAVASQAAIALENARLYAELNASNARLMQANRLKSQFLASMSHELRTPLNSIIGFSKVLLNRLDGDLTERQEAYIQTVRKSSAHLLELINGVLDISRIEAGKVEAQFEKIDLHTLVDECIEFSMPLARAKSLKLEKDVSLDVPLLQADRTKVKQVLFNLLSNAIKFTQAGRVVVRVQPEPGAVHVSVSDTGIGIRASDLLRLFEPFVRLDNPLAREAGGTGLGLALSKKFIELHGGRIWAESREKYGSTFHFTLPLVRPEN